jgi:hypothetical protein
MILPPQNVSLSKAVLMRKGGEDEGRCGRKAGQTEMTLMEAHLFGITPTRFL